LDRFFRIQHVGLGDALTSADQTFSGPVPH
jgi:hypothetical protein